MTLSSQTRFLFSPIAHTIRTCPLSLQTTTHLLRVFCQPSLISRVGFHFFLFRPVLRKPAFEARLSTTNTRFPARTGSLHALPLARPALPSHAPRTPSSPLPRPRASAAAPAGPRHQQPTLLSLLPCTPLHSHFVFVLRFVSRPTSRRITRRTDTFLLPCLPE